MTVLINISIKAELSETVEHLTPPLLSSLPLLITLPSFPAFTLSASLFRLTISSPSHSRSGNTDVRLAVYTGECA